MIMKTRYLLTVLLLSIVVVSSFGQITFEKTFFVNGDNAANDVRQTSDGGYIICGSVNYASMSSGDIILIKTDANGDTLWTRIYGGNGAESGNSVIQTEDGGYIIAGSTNSYGAGSTDAYLIKTNAMGNVLWSKTIGTASGDAAYGIIQTQDGGYVFSGYENSFLLNGQSHLVKTDAAGNVVWSKTYGVSNRTNFSFALQQTDDGGYMLGGYENQFLSNNYEYSLIKTDGDGNMIWYKTIGDADLDRNFTLARSSDGGFVVAGTNFTVSSSEINLVKVDGNGTLVWTKKYGGIYNEFAFALSGTSDGGFVFGGFSASFSANNNNSAYFGRTDADGNLLWSRIMDGAGYDIIYAIRETGDGGFALAGVKNEVAGVSGELYFAKTDANGNTGCNIEVNSVVSVPPTIIGNVTANASSTPLVNTVTPPVYGGAVIASLCSSCNLTATIVPSGSATFCSGTALALVANGGSGISYQWYRNNVAISGATNQVYSTKKGGNFYVTESVSSSCNATSEIVKVTKLETPAAEITPLGNLDICEAGLVVLQANSGTGLSYQWQKGANVISGATNQLYTATSKGNYKVTVTAVNGCGKVSPVVKVTNSCKDASAAPAGMLTAFHCYPNPSNGQFHVEATLADHASGVATLEILNVMNQSVHSQEVPVIDGRVSATVDAIQLVQDGMYYLRLSSVNKHYYSQMIIAQ